MLTSFEQHDAGFVSSAATDANDRECAGGAGRTRHVQVRSARALDMAGLVLWAALTGWVLWTAREPADAAAVRDLLLAVLAVHVAARLVTRRAALAVPLVLMLAGTSVATVWVLQALLSPRMVQVPYAGDAFVWLLIHVPLAGEALLWWRDPLGYANATAALTLVGASAALVVAARGDGGLRRVALAAAALCAVAPALHDAQAGALLATALVVLCAVTAGPLPVGPVARVGAGLVIVVLGATTLIGAAYNGTGVPDAVVGGTLSGNRALLWGDALDQVAAAPLTGVGTNRFAEVSPTARGNPDLQWAHHEFLQLAGETGLPGLLLGIALTLWVFARIAAGPRHAGTAFVAAGLAAVCVAAQVDYIWHFPVVALATAALAGCGGGAAVGEVDDLPGRRETGVLTARAGDPLGTEQPPRGHHEDP